MTENKILLFVKVPPPITGATLMNQQVYESVLLRTAFLIRAIPISYMKKLDEMGKWQFGKLLKIIEIFVKLFYELVFYRPRFVYFQISPHGYAFYRDLLFITLIKLFRVKILYHLHGKGMKEHVKSKKKHRLYTFAFRGEDVICLSVLLKDDIDDFFKGKIYIVNNGIPDVHIVNRNKEEKPEPKKIRILYLSNLIRSKGILDFIDALEILKNQGVSYRAEIVGTEADVTIEELQGLIAQKNLEAYVIYHGSKYGKEKDEIIAYSNILVFPTKNDVWGNVILEAMQFSVPVIATIEGAIPEIVDDGITGYLVEKNAPQQIAEKLRFLIDNPEQRIAMGKAGKKKFEEKYTLAIFEQNMKNVFEEVIHTINAY
jgi:glycosyltransferase involved in cell wall biosynthesis